VVVIFCWLHVLRVDEGVECIVVIDHIVDQYCLVFFFRILICFRTKLLIMIYVIDYD